MHSFVKFTVVEKHTVQHFVPVFIGIGICLYFCLDNEPNFWYNLTICLLLLLNIFLTKYKKIFICVFLISFGVCISQLRTIVVNAPMLKKKINHVVKFAATIDSCEKIPGGMRFIVSDIEKFRLRKIVLIWRTQNKRNYNPGDKALFYAKLYPLTGQSFPLAYDFKRQQYFRGIGAKGFISEAPVVLKEKTKFSFEIFIEKIRHNINTKIEKVLSGDTSAITKALITGEKAEITQEVRAKFANSGTAHLLAISGLHMGIIGFFIFWLFRIILCCVPRVSRLYDVKKIAAIISLGFITFYLYISGCSVPSIRAFIMHLLIIVGILCNRVALSMRSIAVAATAIMIFSPEVIMFPGFQMSFSAVIAIVAFYERYNNLGRGRFLFGIIITTLVASIPTSLFSMFSFNQLTLNSILANIVCVPLMSFAIMPLAVIVLFLIFSNLYVIPIRIMGSCINLLIRVVDYTSTLPGSYFTMYTPTPSTMCIFIFSGLFVALIQHKVRFVGFVGIFCGIISYYCQTLPDILVSPRGTVVGFRTKNCTCFNTLQRFKSMSNAWTKSVGLEKKENFQSEACKKYVEVIDENSYLIKLYDQLFTVSDDKDADVYIDTETSFAKQIYLPTLVETSTKKRKRPWS